MVIDPGNGLNTHTATSSKARQGAPAARESRPSNTDIESSSPSTGDSVSLSDAGQAMAKLEAKLSDMPEVNSDIVAEVKADIANGRFQVDADAIASKMLEQDSFF
ncbi:anti-sigma-28 factor, FlgM family [Alteromonadaceae bacterium Bs31]|nr:anti-sigma-28 factor, FlgM family [Alteromonadaceae bacterium Bs31]